MKKKNYFLIILMSIMLVAQSYTISTAGQSNFLQDKQKMLTTAYGTVVDIDTEIPVSNATIEYVNTDTNVTKWISTDANGEFKINNIETGYYNWRVESNSFNVGIFSGYPIIYGGNSFNFEISKTMDINLLYQRQIDTDPGNLPTEPITSISNSAGTGEILPMGVPQDPPNIPNYVKVRKANGTIVKVQIEDYIRHVISREMDPNYYIYTDAQMTDTQKRVMLEAQAITARSYAAYHFYAKDRHTTGTFDFCDGTHCQVYDPTYCPTLCTTATNNTAKKIAIKITDTQNWVWQYIDAVFFASCKGATKNNEAVWPGAAKSYLRSVSCPYDIRPTLSLGHGVGFCQDGCAGYAKHGYTASSIVSHYFTGISIRAGSYYDYY